MLEGSNILLRAVEPDDLDFLYRCENDTSVWRYGTTTQQVADAAIASIAPMLTFTPTGPSAFDRPELRLYYRAAHQNDGARALYATGDPRAVAWTHFLGVAAEWWWNSNSYR